MVPIPKYKNVIGTKWVFINKINEQGKVVRNKERLICKGYSQQEGIDYEESYEVETLKIYLEKLLENLDVHTLYVRVFELVYFQKDNGECIWFIHLNLLLLLNFCTLVKILV